MCEADQAAAPLRCGLEAEDGVERVHNGTAPILHLAHGTHDAEGAPTLTLAHQARVDAGRREDPSAQLDHMAGTVVAGAAA